MIDIFVLLLLTWISIRVALDCVSEHVTSNAASSIQLFFCVAWVHMLLRFTIVGSDFYL